MLNLEITGDQELEAGLNGLGKAVANTNTPAQKAGEILSHNIEARMLAGGEPKYADIKPASRKARKGDKNAPALIDRGDLLKAAAATQSGAGGHGVQSLFELTADGLTKGVEGASVLRLQNGFHGTDSKGRKIDQAARPFVETTQGDEREITDATDDYVQRLVEKFL